MNLFCLLILINNVTCQSDLKCCLESVKELFDTYVVCNTFYDVTQECKSKNRDQDDITNLDDDSDDHDAHNDNFSIDKMTDTKPNSEIVELIQSFMKENNKLGDIIEHPWKNFGYNKTYLFEYFKEKSKVSDAKYIVWLDPSEIFVKEAIKEKNLYLNKVDVEILFALLESKQENVFMFPTLFSNSQYDKCHIVRNNQTYKWNGLVNETLEGETDNSTCYLNFFYVFQKQNKELCQKNVLLLEEFLKVNSINSNNLINRYIFYLAHNYECTNNKKKAIELYENYLKIKDNNNADEKYVACLRLGRLCDEEFKKIYYWLQANDICPDRLESICELMMHYHNKKDYKKACIYGDLASDKRNPKVFLRYLFCEKYIYDYYFDFYYAICLYYNNEFYKAYIAGNRYSSNLNNCPNHIKTQAESNLKFYTTAYKKLNILT
jgi:hypothetical protein